MDTTTTFTQEKILFALHDQLMVMKVVGEVSLGDLLEFFGRYFAGNPRRFIACDVSEAPVVKHSSTDAAELNSQLALMPNSSTCEMAAIIAPDDLHYGISRMWAAFAEAAGLARSVSIFRSREDAEAWLGISIPVL